MDKKIYFAGSIRGGREDATIYHEIIQLLQLQGTVLTEHVGSPNIGGDGESEISSIKIHDRDMNWLLESDIIVAEVTNPSLGVGYEIGRAVENGKKIVCLFRKDCGKNLSAMIGGSKDIQLIEYTKVKDLEDFIENKML